MKTRKKINSKFLGNNNSFIEMQLVIRVRELGDHSAYKKIYKAYYKQLRRFARYYMRDLQKAEDIVQSVFLNIWVLRKSWYPKGNLKNYLFNAVKNEALNVIRHNRVVEEKKEDVADKYRELKKSRDNHIGDRSQIRQIIKSVVGGAVGSGNSCPVDTKNNRQLLNCNIMNYLVISTL